MDNLTNAPNPKFHYEIGREWLTPSIPGLNHPRLSKISTYIEGNQFEEKKLSQEQKITPAHKHYDV